MLRKMIALLAVMVLMTSCGKGNTEKIKSTKSENAADKYTESTIMLNEAHEKVIMGEPDGIRPEEYQLQLPFRIEPNSLQAFTSLSEDIQSTLEDTFILMDKKSLNRLVFNVIDYTLCNDGSVNIHSFVSNGFDKDILSYGYNIKLYSGEESNTILEVTILPDESRTQVLHSKDTEYVFIKVPKECLAKGVNSVEDCCYIAGYNQEYIIFAED